MSVIIALIRGMLKLFAQILVMCINPLKRVLTWQKTVQVSWRNSIRLGWIHSKAGTSPELACCHGAIKL